jgi:NTE family protein
MKKTKKNITLALQGGGSHGAFTWGVLEKLFEEDVFNITGICGTSAGAVNAAVAVYGFKKNGNKGAIELLETFWKRVSLESVFSPVQPTLIDKMLSPGNMVYSPGYNLFMIMSGFLSPYQWNPTDINPLRDILLDIIDFEELRQSKIKLFACATNVKTGQAKVFCLHEMSVDTVLASACLPQLFKAVQVGTEYYWDGGFMGNPPLFPLISGTDTTDILLVQLNPGRINKIPQRADEIQHRINEISFNSSLIAELRAIRFKDRIMDMGFNMGGKLRKLHYHSIYADDVLEEFDVSSKSNTSWDFLCLLRQLGREYAGNWIADNYDKVGKKASADFSRELQDEFFPR